MRFLNKYFRILTIIRIILLISLNYVSCCEEQLIELLSNQGFNPECDNLSNIVVDGRNSQKSDAYLELSKSVISNANRIIFRNFNLLNFKKITLNKIERSSIDDLAFIEIQQSNAIIFDDVQIFYEQESNIFSFLIQNNQNVQINSLAINFLNGYAPFLQQQNPTVLRKQLISQLIDNKEVIILDYSFNYNQSDDQSKEFNDILGLYLSNSTTVIKKLNVVINYNKYQVMLNNNFLINILLAENYDNKVQMNEVNINLLSIKNEFGFIQASGFIQFICKYNNDVMCGEIHIGTLNIKNKNLILNMLIFDNQYNVTVEELNHVDSLYEEVLLVNQIGFIRSVLLINTQVKNLVLNKVNILQTASFQYYYILNLQNLNNDINFQLNEFNMLSSNWTNTMLYIYQDQQSEKSQYIMINMKNSNYIGLFPLLFMFAQYVTLNVDIETHQILQTSNGLIQINYPYQLNLLSSKVKINSITTNIDLGRGAIIQIFHGQYDKGSIIIKDFQFESFSNSIINSRQGGVFYIHKGQIYFQNVTASGFNISGNGAFAYIRAYNISIENCSLDHFSSGISGGIFIWRWIVPLFNIRKHEFILYLKIKNRELDSQNWWCYQLKWQTRQPQYYLHKYKSVI
ncbi:hypothetical protein TTHERM_00251160 (macronuclear) [Tetrahymena thermophila SB210]|uniref:Transmembrane protein n=1 Tax=Tetrahymena thermophila (strain SB210) TaxID=312017 RepID=Q23QR7_TETTS|nr:hypothetical protein TTHERM_00251160 [Tetrahymena thermophila SB210]EAR98821.2 hypothetical protein TTHERM_00251160 [Tetrahymena thermophila SB210]|eukprot:XP_001019066.2 hypothetical protein TTHERM_00251160 [Tetrahymena thermophila SB210]